MRLNLDNTQRQTLSPQMLQYMRILQFSSLELKEHIEKMACENPVMELENTDTTGLETTRQERLRDIQRKLDWLSSSDRQNSVYYSDDSGKNREEYISDMHDAGDSLAEYLRAQLLDAPYMGKERKILEYLINSLDSRGYYTEPISSTADFFGEPAFVIEELLDVVQSLDPAGVGARDLRECLLLQIRRKKGHSYLAQQIIEDGLEELGRRHIQQLMNRFQVSREELLNAVKEISALNPKPGNSFNDHSGICYVTPDVLVVKLERTFGILTTDHQIPSVSISAYYRNLAQKCSDSETRKYLVEKIRQAETLQEEIRMRESTLSRISRVLVGKQLRFFEEGPGNKAPMSLQDIAAVTDLSISTVSRTLHSKYLQCSWGIYPMNYFLTPAFGSVAAENGNGTRDLTADAIHQRMREIIDSENKKKPLSDQKIVERLAAYDINISRRTVAKYRQLLGIPDKIGRRSL